MALSYSDLPAASNFNFNFSNLMGKNLMGISRSKLSALVQQAKLYLEANFLLPINLCQRYASVTFLIYSKFNLTLKKKLSKIPCISLENCASVIMALLLSDNVIFNSVAVTHTSECTSLYIPGKIIFFLCLILIRILIN